MHRLITMLARGSITGNPILANRMPTKDPTEERQVGNRYSQGRRILSVVPGCFCAAGKKPGKSNWIPGKGAVYPHKSWPQKAWFSDRRSPARPPPPLPCPACGLPPLWYTRAAARRINSGALMADAWHHRSDALSSVGSFVPTDDHDKSTEHIRCRVNCIRHHGT